MTSESSNMRKLGSMEYLFAKHSHRDFKMLINALIVNTKHDLNENRCLILNIILKWKQMHPLLNVCIDFASNKSDQAYFKRIVDEYNFENVNFFSSSVSNFDDNDDDDVTNIRSDQKNESYLFNLLIEREAAIEFDISSSHLWRLTFFKFNETLDNNCFKYGIIFTVQHVISDLKNHFTNLTDLIASLGKVLENPDKLEELFDSGEYSVIDYADDIFKNKKVLRQNFFEQTYKYDYPLKPSFLSSEDFIRDPSIAFYEQKFQNPNYVLIDEKANTKTPLKNLIRDYSPSSNQNKNSTRLMTFKFERQKVEKLLEKCKSKDLKLNGVLNMLIILSMKNLFEKYGQNLSEFNYMNSISLRQFLPSDDEKNKQPTFSYMANTMPIKFSFSEDESVNSSQHLINTFWFWAKKESNLLHEKFRNNQQFVRWDWGKLKMNDGQESCLYFLSNLGSFSNRESSIHLKESFITLNLHKSDEKCVGFGVSVVTIDSTLCWSLVYHNDAHNYTFLDLIRQKIIEISDKIICIE